MPIQTSEIPAIVPGFAADRSETVPKTSASDAKKAAAAPNEKSVAAYTGLTLGSRAQTRQRAQVVRVQTAKSRPVRSLTRCGARSKRLSWSFCGRKKPR